MTPEETTKDKRDPGSICPYCSGDISALVTASAIRLLKRTAKISRGDSRKGFASMTPERRSEVSSLGGSAPRTKPIVRRKRRDSSGTTPDEAVAPPGPSEQV